MRRGAAGGNTSIVWNGLDLLSRAVESGGLNDFSGLNLESSFWRNIPTQLALDYSRLGESTNSSRRYHSPNSPLPNSWDDQKQLEVCDLLAALSMPTVGVSAKEHISKVAGRVNHRCVTRMSLLRVHSEVNPCRVKDRWCFIQRTPCSDIFRNSTKCGCTKQHKFSDGPSQDVRTFNFCMTIRLETRDHSRRCQKGKRVPIKISLTLAK